MDTAVLRIESRTLAKGILDAIAGQPQLMLKRRDIDGRSIRLASGYDTQIQGFFGGYHLCFSMDPRSRYKAPGRLQFHLSRFGTWLEFKQWLEKVIPGLSGQILNSRLERLDLCLDIALPFKAIAKSVDLPGCRAQERWASDGGCTLYLGDNPRRFRIYEKHTIDRDRCDFVPVGYPETIGPISGTRIEIETHRKKVPIKFLCELEDVCGSNPFSALSFAEIGRLEQLIDSKTSHLVQHFLKRLEEVPYAVARREFNTSGNFSRTIAPFIGEFAIDLDLAWKTRTSRFFKTEKGGEYGV